MISFWDNLDQEKIQKTFRGWPKRVEVMIKSGGHHIEHKLGGGKKSGDE